MHTAIYYKASEFPLAPFMLSDLPEVMIDTLNFLTSHTTYALQGGAAYRLLLKDNTSLTDLDILVMRQDINKIEAFFTSFTPYIFWGTNFFKRDKCALFWPSSEGFYKIEIDFCLTLPHTLLRELAMHSQRKDLAVVSGEWLWLNKLEKIGRCRKDPLPSNKLLAHTSAVIELGLWLIKQTGATLPISSHQLDHQIKSALTYLRDYDDTALLTSFLSITEKMRMRCIG